MHIDDLPEIPDVDYIDVQSMTDAEDVFSEYLPDLPQLTTEEYITPFQRVRFESAHFSDRYDDFFSAARRVREIVEEGGDPSEVISALEDLGDVAFYVRKNTNFILDNMESINGTKYHDLAYLVHEDRRPDFLSEMTQMINHYSTVAEVVSENDSKIVGHMEDLDDAL